MTANLDELAVPAEIERLALTRGGAEDGFDLTLDLRLVRPDGTSVAVTFSGVRDLEIHQNVSTLPVALVVTDLREQGWDRLRWQVADQEQDGPLRFRCARISLLDE